MTPGHPGRADATSLGLPLVWAALAGALGAATLALGLHAAPGALLPLLAILLAALAVLRHRKLLEARLSHGSLALRRAQDGEHAAQMRLAELEARRRDFLADTTRGLRTPLTVVLSLLDSVLHSDLGHLDASQRELFQPVWHHALRLHRLIEELLEVSRFETTRPRLTVTQADIVPLLEDIAAHARPLAARKGVELALVLTIRPPDLFFAATQIEHAIINLLSLVVVSVESQSRVVLALRETQGEVELEIHAEAAPEEGSPSAEPAQGPSSAPRGVSRPVEDIEIGLLYAERSVALHGGSLEIERPDGGPARVLVRLPRGTAHLEPEQITQPEAAPFTSEALPAPGEGASAWATRLAADTDYHYLDLLLATDLHGAHRAGEAKGAPSVLVVEDHPDLLQLLSTQLSEKHKVTLARDGQQGLALAQRQRPDLVITDYTMPGMDGSELVRALRADPRTAEVPVIMLTARSGVQDRLDARGAGADIYLTKPHSFLELQAAIAALLAKRGRQAATILKANVHNLELVSAGLAHQLHNPLHTLGTALYVIEEEQERMISALCGPASSDAVRTHEAGEAQERLAPVFEAARRAVERMTQVTALVRRYAREGYPTEPTPIVLDESLRDALRLVAPRAGEASSVEMDLKAGSAQVACIPEELSQVFHNLLQNALDASLPGGTVTVRSHAQEGWGEIEIEDEGQGIQEDEIGRIFSPFYTTKHPSRSLGIGLAISLQVVTAAGGTIRVRSRPGCGATFTVRLPLVPTSGEASHE